MRVLSNTIFRAIGLIVMIGAPAAWAGGCAIPYVDGGGAGGRAMGAYPNCQCNDGSHQVTISPVQLCNDFCSPFGGVNDSTNPGAGRDAPRGFPKDKAECKAKGGSYVLTAAEAQAAAERSKQASNAAEDATRANIMKDTCKSGDAGAFRISLCFHTSPDYLRELASCRQLVVKEPTLTVESCIRGSRDASRLVCTQYYPAFEGKHFSCPDEGPHQGASENPAVAAVDRDDVPREAPQTGGPVSSGGPAHIAR